MKGKSFERTIRLIQETLKESPNTKIYSNAKIKNQTGRPREIDILITCQINDFDIAIAIECKDYKNRVPVKEIEAFNSKCELIKEVNKKVFVSSSGFQSGAIESARVYGIELLETRELSKKAISKWMPISKLGMGFLLPFKGPTLFLDLDDREYLNDLLKGFDGLIRFRNGPPIHVANLLTDNVNQNKETFWKYGLLEWMRLNEQSRFEPILLNFKLQFKEAYILSKNEEETELLGIETGVEIQFKETEAVISDAKTLEDSSGNFKANAISIKASSGLTTDIVVGNNDKTEFYITDSNGLTKKLETLLRYDPETDSFT